MSGEFDGIFTGIAVWSVENGHQPIVEDLTASFDDAAIAHGARQLGRCHAAGGEVSDLNREWSRNPQKRDRTHSDRTGNRRNGCA